MTNYWYSIVNTPYCDVIVVACDSGLVKSHLCTNEGKRQFSIHPDWVRDDIRFVKIHQQIDEYFSGIRMDFEIPLYLQGTPFQKETWQALQTIPFGEVRSYKQIAEQIGNSKAARAIGMANSKNPLPLIIPCHRVIGANGKLTGFAHGINIKEKLLQFEKHTLMK